VAVPTALSRLPKRRRICATCHFEICAQLDGELAAEQLRLRAYQSALDGLQSAAVAVSSSSSSSSVDESALRAAKARQAELAAQQAALIAVLDSVLNENQQVRAQARVRFNALKAVSERERELELQLFHKRERWHAFQSSLAASQLAATMREAQVRQLKSVRVHLDLFPIVQCEFGGVECALLLDNIAAVAGAPSVRARVIPLGSRSLVQLLQPGAQQADDRVVMGESRVFALYGSDERAAFAASSTLVSSVASFLTGVTSRFLSLSSPSTKQAVSTSSLISSRRSVDTNALPPVLPEQLSASTAPSDVGATDGAQAVRERDTRTEFDCAIALLLCCVDDVAQFIRRGKPNFTGSWKDIEVVPNGADERGTVAEGVPVVVIGGRKARASRADMKEWTHAMKYMLHDLLQLLAVVSGRTSAAPKRSSTNNKP
jgi:hypothetical protein